MTLSLIQTSYASGEWAPKLRSRVDAAKYKSGAALLRNFFVDYSGGGASTRQGTKYISQCKALGSRLVPFQPSVNISYVLEFGQNYIRFYSNGAPIVEDPQTINTVNLFSPTQFDNTETNFIIGDLITFSGLQGLTPNLNGNWYLVASLPNLGINFTITDLAGNPITVSGTYVPTSGTAQRVLTLTSPFASSDLFPNQATGNPGIKWVQDVTSLIICHPSYNPQILTITSATEWTLSAITFGPTIAAPTGVGVVATGGTGTGWFYSYIVTAVDNNGQESAPSAPAANSGAGGPLINGVNPSNLNFPWADVAGAVSYNVYKASPQFSTGALFKGAQYGFVGNVTASEWAESFPGISPDFSQTPPIIGSPIIGGTVTSITLGNKGSGFTNVPLVSIAAAPTGGFTATASASLGVTSIQPTNTMTIFNPTTGANPTGATLTFPNGVVAIVQAASSSGAFTFTVTQLGVANAGSLTGAGTGAPTVYQFPSVTSMSGGWSFTSFATCAFDLNWAVMSVNLIQGGFGYTSAPAVTFSPNFGASATTKVSTINNTGSGVLGAAPVGNPRVPGFYQQRLGLYSPNAGLQSFYMSQPGSFFNFNVSNPSQADDAIFGSIISEELNDIRSVLAVQTGVLALTGKGAWLINGGGGISTSSPITPSSITATPQSFSGANDLRPLKVELDALYVTNKGNYVRDANYDIYANSYVGRDVTVISNHLFFGFDLVDWTWAEEPFKTVWAVRSDGVLLSLGFVKEQELIGWAHHDTNGQFLSVCSVIESVPGGTVDAVYAIVQRLVAGTYVQYVERFADRYFLYGYEDAWSVDCALQTTPAVSPTTPLTVAGDASGIGNVVTLSDTVSAPFLIGQVGWAVRAGGGVYNVTAFTSASQVTASVARPPTLINPYTQVAQPTGYTIWQPVTTVSGLSQLEGQLVTGVADGSVVSPLIVTGGQVTLSQPASKITLGLSFLPQLQTLPLDMGEPTVQGKRKKIVAATLRVADTLGLQLGTSFQTLVTMKDFQIGAIPTTSSGVAKVVDLFSGDGRTIMDQDWQEAGSYCIQQNLPYPATVLGAMPEVVVGDTGK